MRTVSILMLSAVFVAHADTVTSTFVCTDRSGKRSVQDYPCSADQASRELPTVHHDPTVQDWINDTNRKTSSQQQKLRCQSWRDSSDPVLQRRAADECKGIY